MRLSKLFSVLVLVAVVFISGCRTSPIYNVNSSPISASDSVTLKQVKKAILRAGGSLGWLIKERKPGHLIGTLNLRDHVAVVDIKYTKETYNITYKDSVELKYDGTNIHSNYNSWIRNLDRQIQLQLNMI